MRGPAGQRRQDEMQRTNKLIDLSFGDAVVGNTERTSVGKAVDVIDF